MPGASDPVFAGARLLEGAQGAGGEDWAQVIPFFAFSGPIRRVIYTTNAIESLNSTVRRAVRTRGHFPNDRAAMKLIYPALRKIERKWQRPQTFWPQARAEFPILFGDWFPVEAL